MLSRRSVAAGLLSSSLASATTALAKAAAGNAHPRREGLADVPGGAVWWRIVGDGPGTPLLLLHGGPGAGHDYLQPLEALADRQPIIFYDQLGCGRSEKPDTPSLWTIERFVKEVDALRSVLGLSKISLYGHSWGGWLAQEYMRRSRAAASVERLILASTSSSVAEFVAGAQRLLAALPDGMDAERKTLEARGKIDTPAYKKIVDTFYDRHLVKVSSPPDYLTKTFDNIASSRTYPIMNGPNEFCVTGTLKDWDASDALADIAIPTLVLTSEWDEVALECHEKLHRGIRNSEMVVIPQARHLAMVERPAVYNLALRRFL